jgi:hypothetical protein
VGQCAIKNHVSGEMFMRMRDVNIILSRVGVDLASYFARAI